MENNLISVAMATYNGERFLRQQLDSILLQTCTNLEIIICDDKSTDTTYKILREYALHDSRIILFQNETNLGLVKNFEKALCLCTGDYIALADQDDIWFPEKIETLLNNIQDYDLIHSDAMLIDENNTIFEKSFSSYSHKNHSQSFLDYLFSNNVTGCTALFKRSLLDGNIPLPRDVHVHDWWLAILAAKRNGVTYIHQPLIYYRQHNNNQIGATSAFHIPSYEIREKNLLAHIRLLKTIENYFLFDQFTVKFISNLIHYYEDFFLNTFRIKSFFFHCANFQHIHRNRPLVYRIASLLLSFFGHTVHKIIWPLKLLFQGRNK